MAAFIIMSLFYHYKTFAQITVRETSTQEKAVYKPKTFDSLSNFTQQKDLISYKQYIGYKLYFIPNSKKYKSQQKSADTLINFLFNKKETVLIKPGKIPFDDIYLSAVYKDPKVRKAHKEQYQREKDKYDATVDKESTNAYSPYFIQQSIDKANGSIKGKIGTDPKTVSGKYFTILDIQAQKYGEKQYSKLESLEDLDWRASLQVVLKNDQTKDTLYWQIDQARNIANYPFMIVPYFSKQKQLYLDKKLIATKNFSTPVIDVNTAQPVTIKNGDIYTCTDISFADIEKSKYLTPMYFLKNDKGNEICFILGSFENEAFITEEVFLKREAEKKKLDEQRKKEKLEEEKRHAQEQLAFKNECIKKFGLKMGTLVNEGNVALGMTKDMCIYAWGNPIDVNTIQSTGRTTEQWVYNWDTYLYFENGTLKIIQN